MRRKSFALAFALVLAASSLAESFAQTQQWVEVTPPGGQFSVMMPTKPEESTETKDSPNGKYTGHLFISKAGEALYVVGWVDYRPGIKLDVQGEINLNRDNFLKGVEAKLTSERKISLDGHPGLEFMSEGTDYVYKSRVYVVGARPYMLAVSWAKGKQEPPGAATFLHSLKLEK